MRFSFVAAALMASGASAQVHEAGQIFGSTSVSGDIYGYACATNGEFVAVAAPFFHAPVDDEGAIYMYKNVGGVWTQTQRLLGQAPRVADLNLGLGIDMHGSILVAGTFKDQVEVFENDGGTWVRRQVLTAAEPLPAISLFSFDVAVENERIFVGAMNEPTDSGVGTVRVYERYGGLWTQTARIDLPLPGPTLDNFDHGLVIAPHGDQVLIGRAYATVDSITAAGAAWIYRRVAGDTWQLDASLQAPAPSNTGLFGHSVEWVGDLAVVAEPRADQPGRVNGGAIHTYVKRGNTWTHSDTFVPSALTSGAHFGIAIAAAGDEHIVCGAYLDDFNSDGTGSAFLLRRAGGVWDLVEKFKGSEARAGDLFGWDVDIAGGVMVGTAPFEVRQGGTAFVFDNLPQTQTCVADLSGASDPSDPGYGVPDGSLDSADFFYYLDQFVAGNIAIADLTGSSDPNDLSYGTPNGALDAADFFYFLDAFVQGC